MLMVGLIIVSTLLFLSVIIAPLSSVYFLILYAFVNGLASRDFMGSLKITIAGANVFAFDLLIVAAYAAVFMIPLRAVTVAVDDFHLKRQIRKVLILITLLFLLSFVQAASAILKGVPPESVFRMFVPDLQFLLILLPIFYLRNLIQLSRIMYFVVFLCLIFPFGQLFFTSQKDVQFILQGQGTFRLGYGDFNVILSLALIAFIVWRRHLLLAILPALGIVLLAHRSAFIAIFIAGFSAGFLKGSGAKNIAIFIVLIIGVAVTGIIAQKLTGYEIAAHSVSRLSETVEATGTTSGRLSAISDTFEALPDHLFFGIGYHGLYQLRDRVDREVRVFNLLHPHNFIMSSLTNKGLVGTVILLFSIAYFLSSAVNLAKNEATRNEGAFLFSGMLFFVVFATMNTTFSHASYVFWIMAGVTIWLITRKVVKPDQNFI